MRVLRSLPADRLNEGREPAQKNMTAEHEPGLDAFAAEGPARGSLPPSARDHRVRLALLAVTAIAVLQTIPTVLWLQNWLNPAPAVTVAAAPSTAAVLPADAGSAVPPCAPTAADAGRAVAATSGAGEAVKAAPVKTAAPAGLVAGLVSIDAPVPMLVYNEGRLVGTTDADTIMLPVGKHELEFVSEAVGFRARQSVTVQAGRTAAVAIESPRVPVHINAVPWAEVWIDNQRVGETPIGNLLQTVGSHEVTFRHPELGERRMVVVVTMKEPARISIDLRKR
jgi:hypothetical protein